MSDFDQQNRSINSDDDSSNQINTQTSFLTILDDKNQVISLLEKKLENQKSQLMYYLQRDLNPAKLVELSQTCTSEIMENNMNLVLAMNKFNQENGFGSSISNLYRQMCQIGFNMETSLEDQKTVLEKIVKNLCGYVNDKIIITEIIKNPFYLELFNRLLEATDSLRQKLNIFKVCCDRLIILEDERNLIAEHVFSLPSHEKLNYNYILNLEADKKNLEIQMEDIIKDRQRYKERMKELKVIEDKIYKIQNQMDTFYFCENNATMYIADLVNGLNAEANQILSRINQKKKKETCANDLMNIVDVALELKEINRDELKRRGIYKPKDLEILKFVRQKVLKLMTYYINAIEKRDSECVHLRRRLNEILKENNNLKILLNQTQSELKVAREYGNEEYLQLKKQHDLYKAQVENLEVIRDAYTLLVDEGPCIKNKTIQQLEKMNKKLKKTLNTMKNIIDNHKKEITYQRDLLRKITQQARGGKGGLYFEETWIEKNEITYNSRYSISDTGMILSQDEMRSYKKSSSFNVKSISKHWMSSSCFRFRNVGDQQLSQLLKSINVNCPQEHVIDEYELMKDCSKESIPEICFPKKKILEKLSVAAVIPQQKKKIEIIRPNQYNTSGSSIENGYYI